MPRASSVRRALLLAIVPLLAGVDAVADESTVELGWRALPPLPDPIGVGGPFVGVVGDRLVVAGGANFPDAPPWLGGAKVWHARVHLLDQDQTTWRDDEPLDAPLAYGVSLQRDGVLITAGGCDAEASSAVVTRWSWRDGRILREALPPLPRPTTFAVGGWIGDTIHVVGGSEQVDLRHPTRAHWSLDLTDLEAGWVERQPLPGEPRVKAVGAVARGPRGDERLYLFSGEVTRDDATLDYLTDAWSYAPGATPSWSRIADLPRPIAAGTAIASGAAHVLLFSGSTGAGVELPVEERPAFPSDVLAYHPITDSYVWVGAMPTPVVTTTAVRLGDRIVIPSGEVRPGIRTREVQSVRVGRAASGIGDADRAVLAFYLLALVAIGVRFARRGGTTDDYFRAGGRVPWWAAGMSIFATQLSAITFLSIPALAFATDWAIYPAQLTILLMAPVVVTFYLPFFRRLDVTSAYEYLERRFHLGVRLFGSASFILFQLARAAIVVYLPALALSAATDLPIHVSVIAIGVLSTLYTTLGGIEAVVWTDVMQTIVLLGGLIVTIVSCVASIGGVDVAVDVAATADKTRVLYGSFSTVDLVTWSVIVGGCLLQLGPYTADQSVVQRYLTTRDERAAARGIYLNGLLSVPFGLLFFAAGTALFVYYQGHPAELPVDMRSDEVLPLFVAQHLPTGVAGLLIAGVFAASMSSLDSSMHSVSTAFTTDFFDRLRRRRDPRTSLRVARAVTALVGVIATGAAGWMTTSSVQSMFLLFQKVVGLLMSGLVGIFALGIFTRRAHAAGVLIGAAASIAALAGVTFRSDLHFYLYPVVGIGVAVGVGMLASLCLPGPRATRGLTWRDLGANP